MFISLFPKDRPVVKLTTCLFAFSKLMHKTQVCNGLSQGLDEINFAYCTGIHFDPSLYTNGFG